MLLIDAAIVDAFVVLSTADEELSDSLLRVLNDSRGLGGLAVILIEDFRTLVAAWWLYFGTMSWDSSFGPP